MPPKSTLHTLMLRFRLHTNISLHISKYKNVELENFVLEKFCVGKFSSLSILWYKYFEFVV